MISFDLRFIYKRMKINFYVILIYFFQITSGLFCQTPLTFEEYSIDPGSKQHITIPISDDQGNETIIPITIFHGIKDGPILGITAGVHGYEYAPILASQELIQRINPSALTGTIILIQIANVSSFLGRSPYTSPIDNKNLNRVFPGDPEGSMTERIADVISTKVIDRSDYFVDMHSGDAPEDLMAYIAYYQHDDFKEISEKGRQMAMHMGFDHVVVFKTTEKDYMQMEHPSLYCSAQAFKQGIPSVDVECGRLGIIEKEYVDKIVEGVEGLLSHLKMLNGEATATHKMVFIEERIYQSSLHTGFFYPVKSSGDYVIKGMKIGSITDFFGKTLQEVQAESSGIILYMLGTPPVNEGETVVNIGIVHELD